MEFPGDRLYSEYHLWIKLEAGQARIGITDFAKEELGEVDYIEFPEPNGGLSKDEPFGTLETTKAVTDLVAPISGIVVECNTALAESPEGLTDDPYGDGWLVVAEPSRPEEIDELMDPAAYEELVKSQDAE